MSEEVARTGEMPEDWSKRQFLFGTGAAMVIGAVALFAGKPIVRAITDLGGPPPVSSGLVHVYEGDFYFIPNDMTWRVGDTVTIYQYNQSPYRFHEMQIGRGFNTEPTIFGPLKTQFAEDFWDGVPVTVLAAHAVDNFVTNKAIVKCNVNPHPWLLTQPGQGNFSPTLQPGGWIMYQFTVPNKPGQWQYACFVQGFIHDQEGMLANLTIQPA